MADRFYVGPTTGIEDWDLNSNWSTTSGGAGGASFPVAGDDAIFDANSGNCTLDANAECDAITFTGYTSTFDDGGFQLTTNGNVLLVSGMTLTLSGTLILKTPSGGNISFTPAGKTFNNLTIKNAIASNRIADVLGATAWIVNGTFLLETTSTGNLTINNTGNSDVTFNGLFDSNKTSSGTISFAFNGGDATFKQNIDWSAVASVGATEFIFSPDTGTRILTLESTTTYIIGSSSTLRFQNTNASAVIFRIFSSGGPGASATLEKSGSGSVIFETTGAGNLTLEFNSNFSVNSSTVTITESSGLIDLVCDAIIFRVKGTTFNFNLFSGGVVFNSTATLRMRMFNDSATLNLGTGTYGNLLFIDEGTTVGLRSITISGSSTFTVLGTITIDTSSSANVNTIDFSSGNPSFTVNGNVVGTVAASPKPTVNAGNGTWTCKGNVDLTDVDLTPGTGAFKFAKTASAQNITSDGNKFNEVILQSTIGLIALDIFKAARLISDVDSADHIFRFKESVQHEIDEFDLVGKSTNRTRLISDLLGTQWQLLVQGKQGVDHTFIQDSDASPSAFAIDARGNPSNTDGGNNINWTFNVIDTQRILYDYTGNVKKQTRILYDYIPFIPQNVRIIFNPYARDSVRIDWSEFVKPTGFTDEIFYGVYIDGEPYEVDIPGTQTWMDLVGLVDLEDIIIDVVIQPAFGVRFTFDFTNIGDRIKVLFTESGDPNIARYVIFRDDGAGNIDFTKEFGEIVIKDREDILNTQFVPESS